MRHGWTATLLLGASVVLAYGCGDDDSSNPGGSSGNAGRPGAGGSSGRGGSGVGAMGPHVGGTSGTGGNKGGTGSGGKSGRAGMGGSTAGGGAGGEAGRCDDEVSRHQLAQCSSVSTTEGPLDTIQTTCSFDATCDALHCGEVSSPFDASGCRRQDCTSSADCGAQERCFAPPLAGLSGCFATAVEGCSLADGCHCGCAFVPSCDPAAYCMPASEHPAADDCPLGNISCGELGYFIETLQGYELTGAAGEGPGDLGTALAECLSKAQIKQASCNGSGGAGGEGGDAGHGGQAGGGGQSGGGQSN